MSETVCRPVMKNSLKNKNTTTTAVTSSGYYTTALLLYVLLVFANFQNVYEYADLSLYSDDVTIYFSTAILLFYCFNSVTVWIDLHY